MENCYLCGGSSETPYPIVGIGKDEAGEWAAFTVCTECHENPAHRTREGAKLHFHSRNNAAAAVAACVSQVMLDGANEAVIRK